MAVPAKPSCTNFQYLADYSAIWVEITAADSTHTGFNIYRDDGSGYSLCETNGTPDADAVYSTYLGSEADTAKPWKATTYNADGESEPVLFGSQAAAPVTATPTNPTATRRATANTIPDAQWIDLTWNGTLVAGDSWRVVLKDYMGYGNDTPFTTSANALAIEIGQWVDRVIDIYPVGTPANKATIGVPSRPPVRSIPTNLTATITTTGNLTVEFDSDWLWLAINNEANDNVHPTGLIWYGLYDQATQTTGPMASINPGRINILSNSRFSLAQILTPTPSGKQYQVTVEIGSDAGGFSNLVMETKPPPVLALPENMTNTLTSLVMFKRVDPIESDYFIPFYVILEWAFSDAANPRAIEVETKIDDSEWRYTGISVEGYAILEMGLHGSRYSALDQTGSLDSAHYYAYSDGYISGNVHTVRARARIAGTANAWIEAPQTFTVPLRSKYYHHVHWAGIWGHNGATWRKPTVFGDYPPGQIKHFAVSVDGSDFYPSEGSGGRPITVDDWVFAIPRSYFDGQQHSVVLKTQFITAATGLVNNEISSVPFATTIPTRSSLMPTAPSNIVPTFKKIRDPFTNLQTGCEYTARLTYDSAMLKAAVSVDNSAFSDVTWVLVSAFPPTVKFTGVTTPRDGLSHIVKLKVWHHDSAVNEVSTDLLSDSLLATFDMAPPAVPTAVTAVLVRDGAGEFPDQVRVSWVSTDPVDIFVIDPDAKKRTLYSADAQEQTVILENSRKYGPQNGQPHEYRFGAATFNRSNYSDVVYATPLTITAGAPATVAQSEDEVAGTAVKLSQAQFITALDTQLAAVDASVIAQVLTAAVQKIKDVVSKGGSVTLDNIGQFAATWTPERTAFRNGQYVAVPAVRNAAFSASAGLTKGTRAGMVLSDIEAANLV